MQFIKIFQKTLCHRRFSAAAGCDQYQNFSFFVTQCSAPARGFVPDFPYPGRCAGKFPSRCIRSEEHTSELQSRGHLVCRLLLEKKNLPAMCCLWFSFKPCFFVKQLNC